MEKVSELFRPLAALAPLVFDLADQGDKSAKKIIQNAGRELGKQVAAVVSKLNKQDQYISVALIGSVFKRKLDLLPYISETATSVTSSIEFIDPRFEPAVGSAILGLKKIGVTVNSVILETLECSIQSVKETSTH